jgi:hypothetical protein
VAFFCFLRGTLISMKALQCSVGGLFVEVPAIEGFIFLAVAITHGLRVRISNHNVKNLKSNNHNLLSKAELSHDRKMIRGYLLIWKSSVCDQFKGKF